MDHDVEARLTRAGLTEEQLDAERTRFDELDVDGRRAYRAWVEQVSNDDIVAAASDDDVPRVPPVRAHGSEEQIGYVPPLTDGAQAPVTGDSAVAADGTDVTS